MALNACDHPRIGLRSVISFIVLMIVLLATHPVPAQASDLTLAIDPSSGPSGSSITLTVNGATPGTMVRIFAERWDETGQCGVPLADPSLIVEQVASSSGSVQASYQAIELTDTTAGVGFYAFAPEQNLTSSFACFMFTASTNTRYFPETSRWVANGFLRYWESFGGLAIFGYPLTDEYVDPNTGQTLQYFERARFEWHPGVWPERYDVLLGRLGFELHPLRQPDYPPYRFEFEPQSGQSTCRYFPNQFDPSVGYNVCNGFRAYWEQYGGLAVFGEPLSQEFADPVTGVVVQWFERARFEWHPGTGPERYDVLLGRLGAERLAQEQ